MSMWTEKDLERLADPDTWDWDSAELHQPVRNPRAVVRLAFKSAEFAELAAAAREAGIPLTDFIRAAALAQARGTTGAPTR
jgi:hypothetical protein